MENAKKAAALKAAAHVGESNIVGLGSGTTAAYAIREIGRRLRESEIQQVLGVPTSHQAFMLAVEYNIPLTTLDEHPQVDITIDGADQVDGNLQVIKGMGGALTREKIVASASKTNVIVIDETKLTEQLGADQPVPIEVLPFALEPVKAKLQLLKGTPILREAKKKLGPVVTDNGNFLLDTDFGPIDDPKQLNQALKAVPGVIETGLFVEMTDSVYVGGKTATRVIGKQSRRS